MFWKKRSTNHNVSLHFPYSVDIFSALRFITYSYFLNFLLQVCRVAYEIMQNYYPDAAEKFKSLDDIYYYGGQMAHNRIAVQPHKSEKAGEISLMVGDLVGVAGNHWNGYSKGRNLRTNQIGLYPSFKVKDKVEMAKFPTYPEVLNNKDLK